MYSKNLAIHRYIQYPKSLQDTKRLASNANEEVNPWLSICDLHLAGIVEFIQRRRNERGDQTML